MKLARFVEKRKICVSCQERVDKIVLDGDIPHPWGYEGGVTVSEQIGVGLGKHEVCLTWARLSLWLLGELDPSYIPWDDVRIYVKCNIALFRSEKQWNVILLLVEEEWEHMVRKIIFWNDGDYDDDWEVDWKAKNN